MVEELWAIKAFEHAEIYFNVGIIYFKENKFMLIDLFINFPSSLAPKFNRSQSSSLDEARQRDLRPFSEIVPQHVSGHFHSR